MNSRIPFLDICRGIGILLVIYGHSLELSFLGHTSLAGTLFPQWKVIYNFHMPLFFIISGTVYKNKETFKVIYDFLYLISIAFIVHIAVALIVPLVNYFVFQVQVDILQALYELAKTLITVSNFRPVVVWFLVSLALVRLIYHILLRSNTAVRLLIVLTLVGLFWFNQSTGKMWFQIGTLLPGLVFFAIGKFVRTSLVYKIEQSANVAKLSVAFIVLIILAPFNLGHPINPFVEVPDFFGQFVVFFLSGNLGFLPLFFLSSILGSYAVFCGAAIIDRNSTQISNFLSNIGQNTIELLIINGFFLNFIQPFIANYVDANSAIYVFQIWAVGLTALQVVILPLLRKVIGAVTFTAGHIAKIGAVGVTGIHTVLKKKKTAKPST